MRKITRILMLAIVLLSAKNYAQEYSLIDFSNASNHTTGNWNNVVQTTLSQTGIVVNLINDQGATTGAVLSVTDPFNLVNTGGTTTPDASLPFPSTATMDSFFGNNVLFGGATEPTGGIEFTGLDPVKYYSFKVFASRINATNNRETQYTFTGTNTLAGLLNASNNTSEVAKVYNILPDASGKITLTVNKGPNNNDTSGFYYLGAIQMIKSDTPYADPIPVAELSLVYPNGGEIWHATSKPYISWTGQNIVDPITIDYSIDGGTTWIPLTTVAANIRKYVWTIPYNVSSNCKVRLTTGAISDISENSFSIIDNTDKRYKIVVLGSSTAAGAGPTSVDNAWVWMYRDYLTQHDTRYYVENLAVGGYTTYDILPAGTTIPGGVSETIDVNRNVTKAIALNADGIIVNMPSNDSNMGYPKDDQIANLTLVRNTALAASIPTWICTVQPRDFGANTTALAIHTEMVTALPTAFPGYFIDFWTGLANAAGNDILAAYDSGDGVHMNNAGHLILLQRVLGTDLHTVVKAGDDNESNATSTDVNYLLDINYNATLHPTPGNWNNMNGYADGSVTGLVSDLGVASTINVVVSDAFNQSNEFGAANPSGTLIFPATATKDAFYGENVNPTGALTFSNLNPAKVYSFEIFASRKDFTDNRETLYTVVGASTVSATLNPSSNSANTCIISDIAPDASGNIVLNVAKGTNNVNANGYYYLNALKLKERNPVLPDVLLDCEDGTTNRLAVLNVFSNGPGQSNADMVVVDNPNPSGINTSSKVVKFTRRTSGTDAAAWAGFYSHVVDPDPDFTENKYVHVKVLKYKATGVRVKIENGAAGTVEKLSVNTYSQLGQWEDIVIDFSEKTGIYATVGLQPDYESPLVADGDRIIYFDDIIINNDPNPIVLSTEDDFLKSQIKVYPNPTKNILMLETLIDLKEVNFFSIEGRQVAQYKNISVGSNSFNMENLSNGLYFVNFIDQNGATYTQKIIKE